MNYFNSNKIYLILIYRIIFFFICNCIIILSIIISKKLKNNFEKISPFECGFNPFKFQRIPFSLRFFLITIIFLIFDVEIALIFPIILNFKISNIIIWIISIIFFILILIIGIIYEWNQGALNWI